MNISAADELKKEIVRSACSTATPGVISRPGLFGGMFELSGYRQPVLVSSIDGVGTKLKLAVTLDNYDGVGQDIVNHSINDILTCGATPLFFLDYIAMGKLAPDKIARIVNGMSMACRESGCALIGGETAEMPGLYAGRDFDLAGCIVGAVEKEALIDGHTIQEGDVVLGIPSSGLHTNGYSLARRVLGEDPASLNRYDEKLGSSVGEALMVPHRSYLKDLRPWLVLVKGLAHITGGGFEGNIPRILPAGLSAVIHTGDWEVPALFQLIQQKGKVERGEMYRVFNMGIGMVVITKAEDAEKIIKAVTGCRRIGEIISTGGRPGTILK